MSTPPTYILLDFETTGLDPASCEIIEIGAIRVVGFEEVGRYHTLVRPLSPIPALISELTGITDEMVSRAPSFEDVATAFAEFLGDAPIVAHNSQLEQGFLDAKLSPLVSGLIFTVHNSIDPLALLLPDAHSHSMENLRKWAGVDFENAHRADKDCVDLLKILVFAHEWKERERPWMSTIVDHFLLEWWWSWYFAESGENFEKKQTLIDLLMDRPFLGDLRDFEKKDDEKTNPEKIEIPLTDLKSVLHGERKPDTAAFSYRDSQFQMSERIRSALETGERVAIEAPTGTGKSVAYLVPGVMAAKQTGSPLIISTHSKALQDQLLEKDIPLVSKLLGETSGSAVLSATTVKGQENYLCLRKLHQECLLLPEGENEAAIEERYCAAFIVSLAKASSTGKIRVAELDRVSMYLRIRFSAMNGFIERVKAHYTTTKGPPCTFYKACHYFDSARIAHQSEVVIANHALVFHWPEHLPKIRDIVFDEAHHLEDQLTEAFTLSLTELDLAYDLERLTATSRSKKVTDGSRIRRLLTSISLPKGLAGEETLEDYLKPIQTRMRELTILIPAALTKKGGRDTGGYEDFLDLSKHGKDPLFRGLLHLSAAVSACAERLATAVEAVKTGPLRTDPAADVLQLHANSMKEYEEALVLATQDSDSNLNSLRLLYWNPRENVWRLRISPVEVKSLSTEFFEEARSITLTSATLSSGANPTFITDRIGLELTRPFVSLPSPYPLAKQATAFFPSDVSAPGTPAHLDAIIGFTENVAQILGGRTMLLMTANHRLKYAAEILRERLEKQGIQVFDSVSDRRAIDAFRNTERAVLIGSERYGEGIDIPGRQLACVIVEKMNESMTRGPLAEARKARTRFGLFDYDFPLRMIWLKQRVGRLIRSVEDRGAVVVFDPRFHGWSAPSQKHVTAALEPIPVKGGTRDEILMKIEAMGI
ncbi:MAG: hypothetical protein H7301_12800 [Cryobacterium sp.]|nr:hypothetical protein [Oligoflexia bacterium]